MKVGLFAQYNLKIVQEKGANAPFFIGYRES